MLMRHIIRLKRLFAWKGLRQGVDSYVSQCQVCRQAKHTHTKPAGLLQPLPIPHGVWQDLSMDFVQGLPKYEGYNAIPMVMDRLTKAAHFIAIRHPYTAPGIARIFLDNVVRHHGLPKTIVTDWDTIFLSTFRKELFKLYGVQLNLSIAYHPQSEGQTERISQCLEMYLGCTIHASPTH